MEGIIKKLTDRGFGFIACEGQEKDLFFHGKSLVGVQFDDLREGDKVSFDIENGEKGPAAVNVKRVEA
jgi:cold shock protein